MKDKSNKTKVDSVQLGCLLKSPISIVQEAVAPKNGVQFCQEYIRFSLTTFYDDRRCPATLRSTFYQSEVTGGGWVVGGWRSGGGGESKNSVQFCQTEHYS